MDSGENKTSVQEAACKEVVTVPMVNDDSWSGARKCLLVCILAVLVGPSDVTNNQGEMINVILIALVAVLRVVWSFVFCYASFFWGERVISQSRIVLPSIPGLSQLPLSSHNPRLNSLETANHRQ
jgi:hypothetical protein